ncbi:MAG: hypothetical protein V7676_02550 [Parasphingorhabdus sp.]|uniref:hypothetical protein n=1 Tax=Parasphingorhabdus sp. TaxID=2709688 RepID=UPI003002DD54
MVENEATEIISAYGKNAMTLRDLAKFLQDEIELRKKYFGENIVTGYGWDVLLELLITTGGKCRASLTAMSTLGGMRATTGLRWIDALSNEGLVTVANDDDPHRKFVALTRHGKKGIQSYLKEVAQLRQLTQIDEEID